MCDVFVMCPDCRVCARLANSEAKIIDRGAKCEHRQNPVNCPILMSIISGLLKVAMAATLSHTERCR